MSCSVVCRCSSDLALLWLCSRPAAAAPIRPPSLGIAICHRCSHPPKKDKRKKEGEGGRKEGRKKKKVALKRQKTKKVKKKKKKAIQLPQPISETQMTPLISGLVY